MVMRIGGLATGMDIDSMVSELMKAHKIPVNKLAQKRDVFLWQRDAYKEINTKLTDFHSKLNSLRLEGTFIPKKVSVSGNTTAVQAAGGANALAGSITIEVNSLAVAASNHSASAVGTADFDPSELLKNESDAAHLTGGTLTGSYSFKINGTQIDVDTATDTLQTVISNINKNANVTAVYDSSTRKVSFSSKETGSVNNSLDGLKITFEDLNGGNFLSNFLSVSDGSPNEVAAADASVVINGLTTTRQSNFFSVNGVDITMSTPSLGTASTISMTSDIDQTIDNIKSFVEDYNNTLKTLQDKAGEIKYRDFPPLTEEQRNELEQKEIDLWEAKAKSGLLRNDPIILDAVNRMRSAITGKPDTGSSVYNSLSSIGIQTGNFTEKGKLYIDEEKLRTALEAEPNAVARMFTAPGSDGIGQGVIEKMYHDLGNSLSQIATKAGQFNSFNDNSFISRQLRNLETEITRSNDRLIDVEDRYYKQFTAMEMAINQLNAQSAFLANAFGGNQQQ